MSECEFIKLVADHMTGTEIQQCSPAELVSSPQERLDRLIEKARSLLDKNDA